MAEQRFQDLLRRNKEYAKNHQVTPSIKDWIASASPDFRGIFVLTCSDARFDPNQVLGLKIGEANVIRNAGGRVDGDVFRSLEVMGSMNPIGLLVVIHHTDCGGLFITDDEVRTKLAARSPEHASTIKDKVFGTFQHVGLDDSVRHDVESFKAWPFLPEEALVVGYVLDLNTGLLREVVSKSSKM